jgi:hypothetical protein
MALHQQKLKLNSDLSFFFKFRNKEFVDNSNLNSNSILSDSVYCNKINIEYELIKNSVLSKHNETVIEPTESSKFSVEPTKSKKTPGLLQRVSDGNSTMNRKLATSTYDNLNEVTSNSQHDTNENNDVLNDIIAQVMLAQCQTEQLDKIDHVQVNWQCIEPKVECTEKPSSPLTVIEYDDPGEEMQIIDSNFIIINDIVIPKTRDHDTSRIEISNQKGRV